MMRIFVKLILFYVLLMHCACSKIEAVPMETQYRYDWDSSANNRNTDKFQQLAEGMVHSGVPGVMMSIYQPSDGMWLGSAGYSCLKAKTPMLSSNITRVGSTVKILTAIVTLQLIEEGKISLDDRISDYLPQSTLRNIENANVATVRELLQHSSGIYNYIQDLRFQTASMNDLVKEWRASDLLSYARGRGAYFPNGTDCLYSNTGYVLLGEMITQVCKRPFWKEFEDRIFAPSGMTDSQFASSDPIPVNLVRGYVDFFSTSTLIESTYYSGWDYHTADGGLISNPYNLSRLLKALFVDKILLKQSSLDSMLSWLEPSVQDPEYYKMAYGLGMFRYRTQYGDFYGHSGDAIGYYAIALFHPETNTVISFATNGNYGKLDKLILSKDALDKIFSTVFQ